MYKLLQETQKQTSPNRIEEMISGTEDTVEEINTSVKENVKSLKKKKKPHDVKHPEKIKKQWKEEGEETQIKGTENIFNKIIEENFPNQKKEVHIKVQESFTTTKNESEKKFIMTHMNQNTKCV